MKKIIKRKQMNGFTLVELLAVIVILAIILVIAVPKVMSVIEDSKKATLESSVKMIASAAEKVKVQNTLLGKTNEITCDSVAKINNQDYQSCSIDFSDNTALVTVKGAGKFEGLVVCDGTKTDAEAQKGKCLITLIVDLNEGTDTVDYESKYEAGSEVTLTEPTREGYEFVEWRVSGADASVNGNTLTVGTAKTTVTAVWQRIASFSTDEWAIIVANVKQAKENGEDYPYRVGETKTIDMGSLGTHTLRVANTTKCSEVTVTSKTACGFVLEFADIIENAKMNDTSTNAGGWPASKMRTYVNSTIYNVLPDALKTGIIETYVISSSGNAGTTGYENVVGENFYSTDKLYLLSPQEVWGTSFTSEYDKSNGTSRQLDYYANYQGNGYTGVSTSKYEGAKKQYSGSDSWWWLRSAYSTGSKRFYYVGDFGHDGNDGATYSSGLAPAFRLAD